MIDLKKNLRLTVRSRIWSRNNPWKYKGISLLFIVSILFCFACERTEPVSDDFSFYTPSEEKTPFPLVPDGPVKNVILLIGDGMGLSHIAATRTIVLGAHGRLYIERMPVTGIIDHYSADEFVSGSAATATSLSTGYKTNEGMIGLLPDGSPAHTILEASRDRGMSTGLVATVTITHATPAAFAAHIHDRDLQVAIAEQLLESSVNVLLGGGRALFKPGLSGYDFKRTDGRDLTHEARDQGYEYVETRDELMKAKAEKGFLLGLFSNGVMLGLDSEPTLAEMTDKALEILSRNDKGFFLMVEGSQIDWGAEDNDINYTMRELLHFDLAVRSAIQFAIKDRETLLVATSDHEAGGMFIPEDPPNRLDGKISIGWGTDGHTGVPVAVFAYGPHAERFMGWYDN
ncbi:MAG: alkaline phosphatase, partial [Candidatus Aminicenantes bacterium]